MTKPTSSAARCDHIISLIDDCLAEFDTGLRLLVGDGHAATPTRVPTRHLSAVRS